MQANWSLILNVLLLIGVIVAIGRLMKAKRQQYYYEEPRLPSRETVVASQDDIIAVRKVSLGNEDVQEMPSLAARPAATAKQPSLMTEATPEASVALSPKKATVEAPLAAKTLVMFLLAKDNRQFAGYELLQTLLTAGLRFGDGQLFHRHQTVSGQGPVMCSLAAATANGVFDMQNIGAFSVRGLCLFMEVSNNPSIDAERLSVMVETARQLSEGLDAHWLDEQRKPVTEASLARYSQRVQVPEVA